MSRPPRTTHRIRFEDLDPRRFEDLCLAIIHPLYPWLDIRHYGRAGSDGGVDILARERLEDGAKREWRVQCRRYSKATAVTLKTAVSDALADASIVPDVLLVVVACDVSKRAHEAYQSYAAARGIATPLLWTAATLEARLYSERPDLLFTYFDVSTSMEARSTESAVIRNIAMKKRLRRELFRVPAQIDWQQARRRPPEKFVASEIIVHSVDDTSYPTLGSRRDRISGWFKLELWDFYFNGLEFVIWLDLGVVDTRGGWAVIEPNQTFDASQYRETKMLRLARIPYSSIVEIDMEGDEYYSQPHLYCRFANGGQPYEGFRRVSLEAEFPRSLHPAKEIRLEANDRSSGAGSQPGARKSNRRGRP